MDQSKRLYWIKLRDDFLWGPEVRYMMTAFDRGSDYVLLYEFICSKFKQTAGYLRETMGNVTVVYDIKQLAKEFSNFFSEDTVMVAMQLYKTLNLVEQLDDGTYQISNFENMVGSETVAAIVKRRQRKKALEDNQKMLISAPENEGWTKGGQKGGHLVDNVQPQKDIDKDTIDDGDDDINQACACEDADPECQFFFDTFSEHVKDIKDEMPVESQRLQSCVDYVQDKGTVMINGTKHRAAEVISVLLWYTVPSNKDKLVEILTHIDDKSAEITNQLTYTTIALYNGARASGAMPGTRRE